MRRISNLFRFFGIVLSISLTACGGSPAKIFAPEVDPLLEQSWTATNNGTTITRLPDGHLLKCDRLAKAAGHYDIVEGMASLEFAAFAAEHACSARVESTDGMQRTSVHAITRGASIVRNINIVEAMSGYRNGGDDRLCWEYNPGTVEVCL